MFFATVLLFLFLLQISQRQSILAICNVGLNICTTKHLTKGMSKSYVIERTSITSSENKQQNNGRVNKTKLTSDRIKTYFQKILFYVICK